MNRLKLFHSKKAINDVSILTGIILVFILIGTMLPYINEEFGTTSGNVNIDGLESDIAEGASSVNSINAFTVLLSVLKMFFWTFGDLPFWLDMIFTVFRIVFVVIIARNIWGSGG